MRAASLLMVCALAPSARAQELELSVDPTGDCARSGVSTEVEAALGRPLGSEGVVLRARVAMRRRAHRVRMVVGIEREGGRSERTLEAADCAAAARAAGLVIALALDPELGLGGENEEIVEPAVSDPPSLLELEFHGRVEPIPETERATPPAPAPVHVLAHAAALVEAGSLPGISAGARLGVGLRAWALQFELDATYVSSARASGPEPGASVELALAYGTLRVGALAVLVDWLRLGAAAELDLGAMSGAGSGARVQDAASGLLPFVALRGALVAEVVLLSYIALRATGSIGTPLVAPTFEIGGLGPVFRPSVVLGQAALSVVVPIS